MAVENYKAQDLTLTEEEMQKISALDEGAKSYLCTEFVRLPGKEPYRIPIFK